MKKAVISLSGGLDSTTTAYIAKSRGYSLYGLSLNYGQTLIKELEMAKFTGKALDFKKHVLLDLDLKKIGAGALIDGTGIPKDRGLDEMQKKIPSTYITFRNGILLSLCIAYAEANGCEAIFIGTNVVDYCLPGSTDIVTTSGIKKLQDIEVGEELWSFNPKTFIMEKKPVVYHKKTKFQNSLLEITLQGGTIFKCTSNHHLLKVESTWKYGMRKDAKVQIVEAQDLKVGDSTLLPLLEPLKKDPNSLEEEVDLLYYLLPYTFNNPKFKYDSTFMWIKSTHKIKRYVNIAVLLQWLAWYITEGGGITQNRHNLGRGGNSYGATISQSLKIHPKEFKEISTLLDQMGFTSRYQSGDDFTFSGPSTDLLRQCGIGSLNKQIPSWCMLLLNTYERIDLFLNTLIKGDGTAGSTNHFSYYSISKELLQQINYLALQLGFRVVIGVGDTNATTQNTCYVLEAYRSTKHKKQRKLGNSALVKVGSIRTIPNTEDLYDLTVEDNHTLIAGQLGFILCSQSSYPDCREEFLKAMEKAANLGTKRVVQDKEKLQIFYPLQFLNKRDIIRKGLSLGVNYKKTWSCYSGGEHPCYECDSCKLRMNGFSELGLQDPLVEV